MYHLIGPLENIVVARRSQTSSFNSLFSPLSRFLYLAPRAVALQAHDLRVIASRRHRRIVVCRRLDTLGSAYSLLGAVSADKNDTQSFLSRLPNELRSSVYNLNPRRKPRIHNQKEKPTRLGWLSFLCCASLIDAATGKSIKSRAFGC